jgi:hypothetical protein
VAFPAPAPARDCLLATPTPEAVDVQQAYVYLLRVVLWVPAMRPKAKIPLVEFPAAEPSKEAELAAPTPHAVDVQVEYVYLLRVVVEPVAHPIANIALVPSKPQTVLANSP